MSKERSPQFKKVLKLVSLALLSAIGLVLMAVVRFPIFPAASFLEYDMADVAILLATLFFDLPSGLVVLVIVSVIQGITVSAGSGWIGIVMHIVATGLFVVVLGCIVRKKKNIKTIIIGMVCGICIMTGLMCVMNLILTPIFMGTPREAVEAMLLPIIAPFNLIKGSINAVVTTILYFPLQKILKKENLI